MAQYTAKYISLPFLTISTIHLQAKQPKIKAVMKPTIKEVADISPATAESPAFDAFITSSKASPRIGGITIRNEN